jgi:hypothetical protein
MICGRNVFTYCVICCRNKLKGEGKYKPIAKYKSDPADTAWIPLALLVLALTGHGTRA